MDNRKAVLIRLDNNQPYYLDDSMYTIGRSDSCSIVIKDPTLSREHARIWWENGNWYLEDSNSANGVELNSVLLEPGRAYILPLGCTILLSATYEFRFGWGPEYDNRTISVPHPEQYANSPAGGSSTPFKSEPVKSDIGNDIPNSDKRNIIWNNKELRNRGNADRIRMGSSAIWAALIHMLLLVAPSLVITFFMTMNAQYTYSYDYNGIYAILGFVFLILYIPLWIFVLNPLFVGIRRYFYKGIRNILPLSEITWGFHNNYKGIVKTMVCRDAILFLWSLAFFIPVAVFTSIDSSAAAILMVFAPLLLIPLWVKSYAYRMVPYILAKDPSVTGIRVLKLSDMMTKGFKGKMFSLDLSFIGWAILSVFTIGILGIFYVNPYKHCTDAEVFNLLF